jgi:hypothetical protein
VSTRHSFCLLSRFRAGFLDFGEERTGEGPGGVTAKEGGVGPDESVMTSILLASMSRSIVPSLNEISNSESTLDQNI